MLRLDELLRKWGLPQCLEEQTYRVGHSTWASQLWHLRATCHTKRPAARGQEPGGRSTKTESGSHHSAAQSLPHSPSRPVHPPHHCALTSLQLSPMGPHPGLMLLLKKIKIKPKIKCKGSALHPPSLLNLHGTDLDFFLLILLSPHYQNVSCMRAKGFGVCSLLYT